MPARNSPSAAVLRISRRRRRGADPRRQGRRARRSAVLEIRLPRQAMVEDLNHNGSQDAGDHFFLCPLLRPGRATP
jgi:hypothetical protein